MLYRCSVTSPYSHMLSCLCSVCPLLVCVHVHCPQKADSNAKVPLSRSPSSVPKGQSAAKKSSLKAQMESQQRVTVFLPVPLKITWNSFSFCGLHHVDIIFFWKWWAFENVTVGFPRKQMTPCCSLKGHSELWLLVVTTFYSSAASVEIKKTPVRWQFEFLNPYSYEFISLCIMTWVHMRQSGGEKQPERQFILNLNVQFKFAH